jgi:hypothetical protein
MEASVADAGSKSFGGDGDDGLLRMAVMNEIIAPEVLPFQTELISKTKDFVDAEVWPTSIVLLFFLSSCNLISFCKGGEIESTIQGRE